MSLISQVDQVLQDHPTCCFDRVVAEMRIRCRLHGEGTEEVGPPGRGSVGGSLACVEDDRRCMDGPWSIACMQAKAVDPDVGVKDPRGQRESKKLSQSTEAAE